MTLLWLLAGVLAAVLFVYVSRKSKAQEVQLLAIGLVIAALIYVGFGLWGGSAKWIGIELVGLIAYSACAWMGVRKNPIWISIGWGLHPFWDLGLHITGVGATFVPYWYAMLCLSFDLVHHNVDDTIEAVPLVAFVLPLNY